MSVDSNSFSDLAKKIFLTGVGAVFMTEESIRGAMSDLKLPKEAISFFLEQAKKQKNDFVYVVGKEISKFLSKINVHEEIQKLLTDFQIHVDATLTFSPKKSAKINSFNIGLKNK